MEVFEGLDLEALRLRYQQQARLGDLLKKELQSMRGRVDDPSPPQVSDLFIQNLPAEEEVWGGAGSVFKVSDGSVSVQVVSVEMETTINQSGNSELKPVPFEPYHSPLLVFRSYR